jgi:hypothetical protein
MDNTKQISTYCDHCDNQFNANLNYYVDMLKMNREVWCTPCFDGLPVLPPEVCDGEA